MVCNKANTTVVYWGLKTLHCILEVSVEMGQSDI